MKTHKVIFAAFAAMLLGAFVLTGCSNSEEYTPSNDFISAQRVKSNSVIVGYVDSNSNYVVYNDSISYIKTQWEDEFRTTFSSFKIEKFIVEGDPDDPSNTEEEIVFLLMGEGMDGRTVAMRAAPVYQFTDLIEFTVPTEPTFTVSCSGCSVGCHIKVLRTKLELAYICNDPCPTCNKTETLTGATPPTNPQN